MGIIELLIELERLGIEDLFKDREKVVFLWQPGALSKKRKSYVEKLIDGHRQLLLRLLRKAPEGLSGLISGGVAL